MYALFKEELSLKYEKNTNAIIYGQDMFKHILNSVRINFLLFIINVQDIK